MRAWTRNLICVYSETSLASACTRTGERECYRCCSCAKEGLGTGSEALDIYCCSLGPAVVPQLEHAPHRVANEHGMHSFTFSVTSFNNLLSFIHLPIFIHFHLSKFLQGSGRRCKALIFHSSSRCEFMPTQIPTLAWRALTFSHEVGRAAKFLL